jgi:hypothetical protein
VKTIQQEVNTFVLGRIATTEAETVEQKAKLRELQLAQSRGEYVHYREMNELSRVLGEQAQFVAQAEALLKELNAPRPR